MPTFEKRISKKNSGSMGMVNAPSIRKVDGRFCLTYYAMGPHHANAMCYALSDSPLGPFTYGGILISLGNALRKGQKEPTDYVGNTHGGMVNVGGEWYTIYHRQTGNRSCGRQICATALPRTRNGVFEHAEYTSLGFTKGQLPAFYCWPAYMACYLTDANGKTKKNSKSPYIALKEFKGGELDIHSNKEMLQVVTNLTSGSVVGFKYFDFGQDAYTDASIVLTARAVCNGSVEICADKPDTGHCIAAVQIDRKNGWENYRASMLALKGCHAIYFIIHCDGSKLGDIAFFEISRKE